MQKGPGPRGEAGIHGDRSRPNDVRGGAAGPGRRLRSFRGVCPPAARWEARADGGGGVASLTRSPPCLPGPGVRLQPALLSRPPSALPGAPTSGAGRRGGQEPKPTPGKNLELGGDPSFSQAPTKDAACRSGGQRGPWGAAGGSTLGAGLTDSAMPNRVPVPGDDWATRLGQTGQKPKHLHFVWFCPI